MGETCRLFIGSRLSGEGRRSLERYYQRRDLLGFDWPGRIAWTDPEKWHLTWLFLGDVPIDRIETLKTRLLRIAPHLQAPMLRLDRVEIWPSVRQPRMAVWGGEGAFMAPVAQAVRDAFFDFPDNRVFRPHVTLARFPTRKNAPKADTESRPDPAGQLLLPDDCWPEPANWAIGNITLFRSHLNRGGDYEALCTASFCET